MTMSSKVLLTTTTALYLLSHSVIAMDLNDTTNASESAYTTARPQTAVAAQNDQSSSTGSSSSSAAAAASSSSSSAQRQGQDRQLVPSSAAAAAASSSSSSAQHQAQDWQLVPASAAAAAASSSSSSAQRQSQDWQLVPASATASAAGAAAAGTATLRDPSFNPQYRGHGYGWLSSAFQCRWYAIEEALAASINKNVKVIFDIIRWFDRAMPSRIQIPPRECFRNLSFIPYNHEGRQGYRLAQRVIIFDGQVWNIDYRVFNQDSQSLKTGAPVVPAPTSSSSSSSAPAPAPAPASSPVVPAPTSSSSSSSSSSAPAPATALASASSPAVPAPLDGFDEEAVGLLERDVQHYPLDLLPTKRKAKAIRDANGKDIATVPNHYFYGLRLRVRPTHPICGNNYQYNTRSVDIFLRGIISEEMGYVPNTREFIRGRGVLNIVGRLGGVPSGSDVVSYGVRPDSLRKLERLLLPIVQNLRKLKKKKDSSSSRVSPSASAAERNQASAPTVSAAAAAANAVSPPAGQQQGGSSSSSSSASVEAPQKAKGQS